MTGANVPDDDPELQEWLRRVRLVPDHERVAQDLQAAEFQWHFVQGIQAIDAELYVPGALSLLAGIEASIRWTLTRLQLDENSVEQDLGATLSNSLLRQARAEGLPVEILGFPSEVDFEVKLNSYKPYVRIVSLRHDLAHGNVQSFINREFSEDMPFFTPECLRPVAMELRQMSVTWARGLSAFRKVRFA